MKLFKDNSGFTLLEFVSAIVIIAILTGLATVSFNVYRQKNRDVKRVTDIQDIQGSLAMYYRDQGQYPTSIIFGSAWTEGSNTYMERLPNNPTPRADNGCTDFEYEYTPDYNYTSYHLAFCLGSPTADLATGIHVALPDGQMATGAASDYNTKLLLHMNGAESGTIFTDSSLNNKNVTPTNAVTTIGEKKFGSASGFFNGSSYLSVDDSDDWDFGSGNFTIDFWIRYAALPSSTNSSHAVGQWNTSQQSTIFGLYNDTGVYKMRFVYSTTGSDSVGTNGSDTGIVIDTWYHIAYVRNGNTLTFYVNGVSKGTVDMTGITIYNSTSFLGIGTDNVATPGSYVNGYLDELRISKGLSRWTTDFTPPTGGY
jgi:prepilin-type N-terminal cleavage/methylation domain-containing protein